jgi:hypothetical protein
LFLAQYLVEPADRFVELFSEPLGTLGVRLARKLAGAARTAGSGSACSTPGSATLGTFTGSVTTAFHPRFGAASGGLSGVARGRTTAQALTGLAHAADTSREWPRVTAIASALTITAIGSITCSAVGTVTARATTHAGYTARHREFDLRHAADSTRLTRASARGTAAR